MLKLKTAYLHFKNFGNNFTLAFSIGLVTSPERGGCFWFAPSERNADGNPQKHSRITPTFALNGNFSTAGRNRIKPDTAGTRYNPDTLDERGKCFSDG